MHHDNKGTEAFALEGLKTSLNFREFRELKVTAVQLHSGIEVVGS